MAPVFNLINTVSVSVLEPEVQAFYDAKVADLVAPDAEYTEISNDNSTLDNEGMTPDG